MRSSCVGCNEPVIGPTREHVLAQWLETEIFIPNATLNQYLRDEDQNENQLLRKHLLNNFVIKNVCHTCNNGWMSEMENRAKPSILALMNGTGTLWDLPPDATLALARWAAKTAFMIASIQKDHIELPWSIFQKMRSSERNGPDGCFVFVGQVFAISKGFTYACMRDHSPEDESEIVQVRIGFSIKRIHLVVVIPLVPGDRIIKADPRMHTSIWPVGTKTLIRQAHAPARFASLAEAQYFLTNLIEAAIITKRN
jgi:hypothetical protein